MKEVKITIIGNDSNIVEEYKGESYLKDATMYLASLARLELSEEVTVEPEPMVDAVVTNKEVEFSPAAKKEY